MAYYALYRQWRPKDFSHVVGQHAIIEREQARKNKDWKKSDELRDALKEAGYIVEDTKQGQKVRKNV